jgi:hypothetical protein
MMSFFEIIKRHMLVLIKPKKYGSGNQRGTCPQDFGRKNRVGICMSVSEIMLNFAVE